MIKAGHLDHNSIVLFVPYIQYFRRSFFEKHIKTPLGHLDLFLKKPSEGAQGEKGGIIRSPVRRPPFFDRNLTDCPRVWVNPN